MLGKLTKSEQTLVSKMAATLSENQKCKYASFDLATMSIPDGRLATLELRLTPIDTGEHNAPSR